MIVDMVRNDLGRVCNFHSVQTESLFDVETYQTLLQMTSTVRGTLREDVNLYSILAALFPAASITGAPKYRTMQIIRQLEQEPRGVYCGSIGMMKPGGDFIFNVAIRTLVGRSPHYLSGIGSGIVWDSEAVQEYDEIETKINFVQRTLPDFHLIETMLLDEQGHLVFLREHLKRLHQSARYWNYTYNENEILHQLNHYVQHLHERPAVIRLLLSRFGTIQISHRQPLEIHVR